MVDAWDPLDPAVEWTVSSRLDASVRGAPALVIDCRHPMFGALRMHEAMNWAEGEEAVDVERRGLMVTSAVLQRLAAILAARALALGSDEA